MSTTRGLHYSCIVIALYVLKRAYDGGRGAEIKKARDGEERASRAEQKATEA
jgi:hypothetical protein